MSTSKRRGFNRFILDVNRLFRATAAMSTSKRSEESEESLPYCVYGVVCAAVVCDVLYAVCGVRCDARCVVHRAQVCT